MWTAVVNDTTVHSRMHLFIPMMAEISEGERCTMRRFINILFTQYCRLNKPNSEG
jgi:hypothetical protein